MNSRYNNFDLIRLLAALQVVFAHAVGHTQVLETGPRWLVKMLHVANAFPGVAVFFVISGFLITRSYQRLRDRPAVYFWNRALRIYPALLVCLAVSLLVLGCLGFLTPEVLGSGTFWAWLAGQVSVAQFFNPEFFRGFGVGVVNGALWTISVELQFYLAIPLIHTLAFKSGGRTTRNRLFLPATFLASFAVFCFVDVATNGPGGFTMAGTGPKLLFVSLLPHWWMFVLGIWLHRHFDQVRSLLEGRFLWHFTAYTALMGLRQFALGRDGELWWLYYLGYLPERVLLATMTVAAAYSARWLSSRLLRGVDISYGVYIYHFVVINTLIELGGMNTAAWVPVAFALAILAGLASWFAVEKRVLALKPLASRKRRKLRVPLPDLPVTEPSASRR